MAKATRGGRAAGGKGLDPKDIVSETSMVSAREGSQREVDEALTTARSLQREYGTVAEDLVIGTLKGKASMNILGYCDGDNVALNSRFFNSERMNNIYDDSTKQGYHPSRGNKTGIQAVMAHEMGHKLTADVAKKLGIQTNKIKVASDRIVNEARKKTNHRGVVQMANKISKYATTKNAEAIAEAVSDVYCNGSRAAPESKVIVGVIKEYLG